MRIGAIVSSRLVRGMLIFLLGGAVTMASDRLYKTWKRRRGWTPTAVSTVPVTKRIEQSLLSPDSAHKLYQMMQVAHEVFGALGITYWADGGTALGALRNKGIILTDDDIDVVIFEKDEARLLTDVKKALNARGYTIAPFGVSYKIMRTEDAKPDGQGGYVFPECAMDVFPLKEWRPHILAYKNQTAYEKWGHCCFKVPETFPLRLVPFGPIKIFVPYDTERYLDRAYPRWNQEAYISNYHKFGVDIEPFTVPLTPELRKPAPWREGFEYIKGHPAPKAPVSHVAQEYTAWKHSVPGESNVR